MCHNHYKENFNGWYSQPVRWYRISGRVVQLNRAVCHERPLFTYEMEPMVFLEEVDGWSIHISSSLYQRIQKYSNEKLENAGVWIGSIEKKIKRVTIVDTFIPEDNERKDNTVEMGKKGVKEYLKSLRTKTNGLLRYIGEWHTHIAGDASPSQKDLKTFCETHPAEDVFLMTILSPSNTRNYLIRREKNEYKRL